SFIEVSTFDFQHFQCGSVIFDLQHTIVEEYFQFVNPLIVIFFKLDFDDATIKVIFDGRVKLREGPNVALLSRAVDPTLVRI
ncbi:hypothetical protein OFN71_36685, partial [Escherichia coli]|nr:hypothetical protein [Escherichia coli]